MIELKIKERITIEESNNGHLVLVYYGIKAKNYGYRAVGTKVVSQLIDVKMIWDAIRLVMENYSGDFLQSALDDFYPRIRSVVNKIFNGQVGLLNVLSDNSDVVIANERPFKKAVSEVKSNENRKTPSRNEHEWMEEKINPDVLRILGI